MTTFDHTIFEQPLNDDTEKAEELLRKLGKQGWELVAVVIRSKGMGKEPLQRMYFKKTIEKTKSEA